NGTDIVLESPTASGKTLAFSAPMLDALVRNPGSHALMIYPMKALAFDQREQIEKLCEPLRIESFPYDGDTDKEHRDLLRNYPIPILLTNPEYLNMSFLAYKEQWEGFLRNLRYVIIDEMHEYRGFFGANMALLLRRFFLHLDRIGANPRVFLSTATCANPAEHAENLIGRNIEVISARDMFRPKRHFVFVNPAIPDFRYREIFRLRIEQAALSILANQLQTLVFCPTKRFLEDALINCKRKAEEQGLNPDDISPFYADMKSDDRREIQQKIKDGEIRIVFTTNALELGLDIGGLDGVILAGFPSNIMSAWQQIGRAGRGWNKEAFVLFYAMNDPIDRFFVGNLDTFLNKPLDELVIDPSNEELIRRHLPSLTYETDGELSSDEEHILGSAFYDISQMNTGTVPKGFKPHQNLNIRGSIGQSFELKRGNEKLGQISEMRRFREAYIGATFTFFRRKYSVHAHEADAVVLTDTEHNLRTDPSFFTVLMPTAVFNGVAYGEIEVYYGVLNLTMNFTGYRIVDERTGEPRELHQTNDAYYQNNLHAFWINVPPSERTTDGISALEHIIRVGGMFVIPADRFDTSTYSKIRDEATAFYYENYSGGIGVAKKLFSVWQDVLKKGIEIAESCECRSGCQNCIEPAKNYNTGNADDKIDKRSGIALATHILEEAKRGPDRRFQDGMMISV
ncbi:DEAD/DEAH box helicase, partial [Candidatus Poribacteria bacterium]|nr:DEAD/DEAH box helicase [Candidatus Poribacteria bacterium]